MTYFVEVCHAFKGELWSVSEGARNEFGLHWVYGCDMAGLSPEPDRIHTGKNSGFQAIGLAHLFGARRIVLLGFDMSDAPNGARHWHGDHPKGLSNGGKNRYDTWRRAMDWLGTDAKKRGLKILNASRRTALKSFPRVSLESALDELRNPVRATDARGMPEPVDRPVR